MSKISFPHMDNYYIPATYFFSHVTNSIIIKTPKITNKTIELGNKYSPEFVCTPFKYTLGTLLESLELGSEILIQAGGGCKYGYYSELQEQILKDLGYDFKFISFVSCGKNDFKKMYNDLKVIDKNINFFKVIYYLFITIKMIKYMDIIDDYIRENIGFEINKNEFINLKNEMLLKFGKVKSYFHLRKLYKSYLKKFKKIKLRDVKRIKIGIIGELYTIMEPFSNYNLEYHLASKNISVKRFTNAYYLLFEKSKYLKKNLKKVKKYIKYTLGADAADNVIRTKYLCENNYDGIIHMKASFCTPEIGVIPIINKVCREYKVPIIFLTMDINTSELGLITRLEALIDMIEMRKNNE